MYKLQYMKRTWDIHIQARIINSIWDEKTLLLVHSDMPAWYATCVNKLAIFGFLYIHQQLEKIIWESIQLEIPSHFCLCNISIGVMSSQIVTKLAIDSTLLDALFKRETWREKNKIQLEYHFSKLKRKNQCYLEVPQGEPPFILLGLLSSIEWAHVMTFMTWKWLMCPQKEL